MQLRKLFINYLEFIRLYIPVFCSIATQTPLSSVLFLSSPNVTSRLQCILSTPQWFLAAVAKSMTLFTLACLLYTSDAADEEDSVDLGGRRIIKKKKKKQ